MSVKYEACARGEKYTTASGDEKQRWIKCGVVIEGKNGLSLKLESIPAAGWDGWLSFFEPKPRDNGYQANNQGQAPSRPQRQASAADMSDDVPF